jgi:hypothetical protein
MTATEQPNTFPRSPSTCGCRSNHASYLAMTMSRSPSRAVRAGRGLRRGDDAETSVGGLAGAQPRR